MSFPPYKLITTPTDWQACLPLLQASLRLAIDLEANSMFAYREQVCLMQISVAGHDFIIDPLMALDLSELGAIIADPAVEKVFHAAEYDLILLKREYGWQLSNLFDTMWAARILGYPRYGLANILEDKYQIQLNKRYQKSNWCQRPLTQPQLHYAQLDTHYLLRLRDDLAQELQTAGRAEEAQETFAQQTDIQVNDNEFDPDSFWAINGVRDLNRRQQAILKALHIFRDQEAQDRNQPLFKVFSDKTLLELAQTDPSRVSQLHEIQGMTVGQIRRYGHKVLAVIQAVGVTPAPLPPPRTQRPTDAVLGRYELLHSWRKEKAQQRGVESDVIISRQALWELARANPQTAAELGQISSLWAWRRQTYGAEILAMLANH